MNDSVQIIFTYLILLHSFTKNNLTGPREGRELTMTEVKSQEGLFLELLVESRQAGVTVKH